MSFHTQEGRHWRTIRHTHPWGLALGLVLAGVLFLPFDVPVAKFCLAEQTPGELSNLIERAEFFGHAYGVLGIAVTICVLDPSRRRYVARLVAIAFSSGLAADAIKLLVHRVRPCRCDFAADAPIFRGLSFTSADSFSGMFDSTYHSLPSAHTAMAVGVAMGLGRLYPRGRVWFVVVASITAASRVDGGAHFVSDVFWGAALGYVVAYLCQRPTTLMGRLFDRWESPRSGSPASVGRSTTSSHPRRAA